MCCDSVKIKALLHCSGTWELTVWRAVLEKSTWLALVDTKLNKIQEYTVVDMIPNIVRGNISKCVVSSFREIIILLNVTENRT